MMDIDKKAFAVLSLIQSDFGQSGGDVQFLAIRDELQQAYNKGLEDADAKIAAQAYLDLLKEMEGKVLVPVDFIKNVSQLINYIDEEGPTAKAWEPITEICESIKAMIAVRG